MAMTEKGLYDIYETWHIPFWQTTWFYILMYSFMSLIIIFIIYFIIKKIKSRSQNKLSFSEQALRDIELLRSQMNGKEFYIQLTAILKRYIAQRYHVDVESKTDDELIAYLGKKHFFNETLLDDISSIFAGIVTIKFAHAQASQEKMEHDYHKAIAFINQTKKEET